MLVIAVKTFAEKIANVSMEAAMGGVINALKPAGRLARKALGYAVAKDMGAKLMGNGGYSFAKNV